MKTFKRDYVYLAELHTRTPYYARLARLVDDYNDHHPHSRLGMRSLRQFRAYAA